MAPVLAELCRITPFVLHDRLGWGRFKLDRSRGRFEIPNWNIKFCGRNLAMVV
jgi:hypothetical protein